jgi:hypothetical protein
VDRSPEGSGGAALHLTLGHGPGRVSQAGNRPAAANLAGMSLPNPFSRLLSRPAQLVRLALLAVLVGSVLSPLGVGQAQAAPAATRSSSP